MFKLRRTSSLPENLSENHNATEVEESKVNFIIQDPNQFAKKILPENSHKSSTDSALIQINSRADDDDTESFLKESIGLLSPLLANTGEGTQGKRVSVTFRRHSHVSWKDLPPGENPDNKQVSEWATHTVKFEIEDDEDTAADISPEYDSSEEISELSSTQKSDSLIDSYSAADILVTHSNPTTDLEPHLAIYVPPSDIKANTLSFQHLEDLKQDPSAKASTDPSSSELSDSNDRQNYDSVDETESFESDTIMEENHSYFRKEDVQRRRSKGSSRDFHAQQNIPEIHIHVPSDDIYGNSSRTSGSFSDADDIYKLVSYSHEDDESADEIYGSISMKESAKDSFSLTSEEQQERYSSASVSSLPDLNTFMRNPRKNSEPSSPAATVTSPSIISSPENPPNAVCDEVPSRSESPRSTGNTTPERKSSLAKLEMPSDRPRRKSVVDLTPFMEPRKSIVELTPAMQARISVFETQQDSNEYHDQENSPDKPNTEDKRSLLSEMPNMERRRSIREEVLELERRYLLKDQELDFEHRRGSKIDIPETERRKSIKEEILHFERQGSLNENASQSSRRSSRDDALQSRRRSSVGSNYSNSEENVFMQDNRSSSDNMSLKKKILDRERRKSKHETDMTDKTIAHRNDLAQTESTNGLLQDYGKVPEIQVEAFADSDHENSVDSEDEYLKSVAPYLKYRKSISDLEPYLQYQNEARRLSTKLQEQLALNEYSQGKKTIHESGEMENGNESRSDSDSDLDREWIVNEIAPNLGYKQYISDIIPAADVKKSPSSTDDTNSEPALIEFRRTSDQEYPRDNLNISSNAASRRSSKNSFSDSGYQLDMTSESKSYPEDDAQGYVTDDIHYKQPRKSLTTEFLGFLGRRLTNSSAEDYEEEITESSHHTDEQNEVIDVSQRVSDSYIDSHNSPRLSLSFKNAHGEAAHDSEQKVSSSQTNQNLLSPNTAPENVQRRKSIGLEVLDFISRRLSSGNTTEDREIYTSSFTADDPLKSPRDSLIPGVTEFQKESVALDDSNGYVSANETHKIGRKSFSKYAVPENAEFSVFPDDANKSPRRSCTVEEFNTSRSAGATDDEQTALQGTAFIDNEHISPTVINKMDAKLPGSPVDTEGEIAAEYDKRRKSFGVEVLDFLTRRFSGIQTETNANNEGDEQSETEYHETQSQDGTTHDSARHSLSLADISKSPRGSVSEENYMSPRASSYIDNRHPRDSVHEEARISPRSSISYERKSSSEFFIANKTDQPRRKSKSEDDATKLSTEYSTEEESTKYIDQPASHSSPENNERRKSIGVEVLEFIARRFSDDQTLSIRDDNNETKNTDYQETYTSASETQRSRSGSADKTARFSRGSINLEYDIRNESIHAQEAFRSPRGSAYLDESTDAVEIRKSPTLFSNIPEIRYPSSDDDEKQSQEDSQEKNLEESPRRQSLAMDNGNNEVNNDIKPETQYNELYSSPDSFLRTSATADINASSTDEYTASSSNEIIQYDQQRKSISMDALDVMVRRFSSEPIPDHQSKQPNNLSNESLDSQGNYTVSPRLSVTKQESEIPGQGEERRQSIAMDILNFFTRRLSTDLQSQTKQENEELIGRHRSSRGSILADSLSHDLDQTLQRESVSTEVSHTSQRGSLAAEEGQRSKRGSIAVEQEGRKSHRGSLVMEDGRRSRRESASEKDWRSNRGSIVAEGDRGSHQGLLSTDDSPRSHRGSLVIEEDRRSHRGSVSDKDRRSSRGSVVVEEDHRSHRGSISADDGHRSHRGSLVIKEDHRSHRGSVSEKDRRSSRGSIAAEEDRRSSRGSIYANDDHRSHRGSLIIEEGHRSHRGSVSEKDRSSRGSIVVEEDSRSRRGSISADEGHRSHRESLVIEEDRRSLRGSVSERDRRSSRGSIVVEEDRRSRRGSISADDDHRSQRESLVIEEDSRLHRGSVSEKDRRSSRGSLVDEEGRRSHRGSVSADGDHRSHRNSLLIEEDQISRRRSAAGQDRRSSRGSIVGEGDLEFHGESISADDQDRSPRGSLVIEDDRRSCRGSTSERDRRSSKGSALVEEDHKSHRGSISADNDSRSHRGSLLIEEDHTSRRRSGAGKERRSSQGSVLVERDHELQRESISVDDHDWSHRRSLITEEDKASRRGSEFEKDRRSSRGSIMAEGDYGSHQGLVSDDDHRSHRGSLVIEEDRRSHRGSVSEKDRRSSRGSVVVEEDRRSHRGSISANDDHRSHRGSLVMEEDHRSHRGSASEKGRRPSRGSVVVEEDRRSSRGSISVDDDHRSHRGSLLLEEEHTSRRGSAASKDRQSSWGSKVGEGDHEFHRDSVSADVHDRSPRGSLVPDEDRRSHRGSISERDRRSSRGSVVVEEDRRSLRGSTSADDDHRSHRGSLLTEKDHILRRGSAASKDRRSSRGSIGGEDDLEFHRDAVSADDHDRSPRGSLVTEEDKASRRGSAAEKDRRSSKGSMVAEKYGYQRRSASGDAYDRSHRGSLVTEEDRRSRRGSASEKDKRSSRGSIVVDEDQRAHRGSVSQDDDSKSPRQSLLAVEDHLLWKGSAVNEDQRHHRGSVSEDASHLVIEEDYKARRESIAKKEDRRQSRESIVEEGRRSQRGSVSAEESHGLLRESVSDYEGSRSHRGSVSLDEGRLSHRGSVTSNDGHRSQRGSVSVEGSRKSPVQLSFNKRRPSQGSQSDEEYIPYGQNVALEQYSQKSFSEDTPEITDLGTDSESGSELDIDWTVNEIESDSLSPATIIESQVRLQRYSPLNRVPKKADSDGKVPDLYEALYGHIMTLLTLPELGGEEHEVRATFVPDVTLESEITDSEWIEMSQNNETISGFTVTGIITMPALSRLDSTGGWTTVDALQLNKKKKPIESITTVTFCGCGFLGVYLVGAATYLQVHAPHLLRGRLAGSSVGSLVAACIACDIPLELVRKNILATAEISQKYFMGPFNPFFPIEEPLLKNLLKMIPEDGHIKASGRLFLSLTRATTLTNEVVSEYSSREELIRALLCCCFLPFISGFTVPTFKGRKYIDGGMSNNMPLKGPKTLTINAFSGEFDICPEDTEGNDRPLASAFNQSIKMTNNNLVKLVQALHPPKPEELDKFYHLGYSDAQKYFPSYVTEMRK